MKHFAVLMCVVAACVSARSAPTVDFKSRFAGYQGCFVLRPVGGKPIVRYNPHVAAERLSPCSTFKVMNSLIGLETGVAKDQNHVYRWDGKKHPGHEEWDRDQTMASAFRLSAVWYYQRLAADIGAERMQRYLNRAGYGNRDISGGITKFWLASTLRISADELTAMLDRLYRDALPFSKRTMHITRSIMVLDRGKGWELSGKTGSGPVADGRRLGWFVGSVRAGGKCYVFATNIRGGEGTNGYKARDITRSILREMGLLRAKEN